MKTLYRFHWEMSRSADIVGLFVSDAATIAKVIGKECRLGESAGKHSDVSGPLEECDLTVLTTDQDFIEKAQEYGLVPVGFDPLDYIWEEDGGRCLR